jgi:DNA-binding response OmpR family regulator
MTPEGLLRILVLADSQRVGEWVRQAMPNAIVEWVAPAAEPELIALVREVSPDLLIVDLDANDPALLAARISPSTLGSDRPPVLGLTRNRDVPGKLSAFRLGVDDVLDMPFTADKLLLRAVALTRHVTQDRAMTQDQLRGDLDVDLLLRRVRVRGVEVRLTGVEWSLLYLLMAHAGEIVTREQILDALWGVDFAPDSNVVERHIRSLRRKLHDDWHHPHFIETIHGMGYRLLPNTGRVPPVAEGGRAALEEG